MILPWDDPVPSAAACSWVQYSGQKNPFRDSTEQAAAFMVGSTAAKMAKHKHTWDIARTKSGSQKLVPWKQSTRLQGKSATTEPCCSTYPVLP